jgi:hypothetical protein
MCVSGLDQRKYEHKYQGKRKEFILSVPTFTSI